MDPQQPIAPASPQPRRSRQARVAWGPRVVTVGGDAPVRVQSMTNTDTVDAIGTAIQVKELAQAGSEMVRITVNTPEAAEQVPYIREQLDRTAYVQRPAQVAQAPVERRAADRALAGHELEVSQCLAARARRAQPAQEYRAGSGLRPAPGNGEFLELELEVAGPAAGSRDALEHRDRHGAADPATHEVAAEIAAEVARQLAPPSIDRNERICAAFVARYGTITVPLGRTTGWPPRPVAPLLGASGAPQVRPPLVDTSTPPTIPPWSAAVPEMVTGVPTTTVCPSVREVMVAVGAVTSVDMVAGTRPGCSEPGCTPMSANRFTVACCIRGSAVEAPPSWLPSRPQDQRMVPAPKTRAPLEAR